MNYELIGTILAAAGGVAGSVVACMTLVGRAVARQVDIHAKIEQRLSRLEEILECTDWRFPECAVHEERLSEHDRRLCELEHVRPAATE